MNAKLISTLALAVAVGGGCGAGDGLESETRALTAIPACSGIDHVIVLMMENRSFDHLLGWVPWANGKQGGLPYRIGPASTRPLAGPRFPGVGTPDPDHSYLGGRVAMTAEVRRLAARRINDVFSIGYYLRHDLSSWAVRAPHGRRSTAIRGDPRPDVPEPHVPARGSDRSAHRHVRPSRAADDLGPAGSRGHQAGTTTATCRSSPCGAPSTCRSARPSSGFLPPAHRDLPGRLVPRPAFLDEVIGTRRRPSSHRLRRARTSSTRCTGRHSGSRLGRTVLIITFDEWGGFFDHVPPTVAPIPDADRVAGFHRRATRVPHPRSPRRVPLRACRGYVGHEVIYDTSVLRLIEWRWALDPLTVRDAAGHEPCHACSTSRGRASTSLCSRCPPVRSARRARRRRHLRPTVPVFPAWPVWRRPSDGRSATRRPHRSPRCCASRARRSEYRGQKEPYT